MKLTVKTIKLQEMVARAIKGASNNKMIPLTSLMQINLYNNKLTLTTTDASNYVYIIEDKVEGEDFNVVVSADTFSKLIARLTCESVTLELKEDSLEVTGNGKYKIDLPLDEEGELIKFPDPRTSASFKKEQEFEVNKTTIDLILSTAKAAVATTIEVPCYTGYYVGDKTIATDTYKICGIDIKLTDKPVLISAEMMNLLGIIEDEKISVYRNDNTLMFVTPSCTIYGTALDGIEDYAVDAINGLLDSEFSSMCKIPKNALLQLLDRLSLFVGTYDKNGIYLTFTRDGININSKASNGSELIRYQDSKDFKEFTCCIDIEMLKAQIKAQSTDLLEIWYGEDNAIKMVDGNVTQIIALLEDDRMTE